MKSGPAIVRRESLYQGWNRLEAVFVEADGRQHRREVVDHGDVAAVLPVDRQLRTVLLARQWRAPPLVRGDDPFVLEACAGIVDPGETPEQTAIREAREELGVRLDNLEPVATVLSSPGTMMEVVHLYIAPYAPPDRLDGGGGLDHEGEVIEVVELGFDAFFALSRSATRVDAKTLLFCQHLLLDEKASGRPVR